MENEERTQLDAQHQKDLNGLKKDVARLTSLLKQALRSKSGEGTSPSQHLPLRCHQRLRLPSTYQTWGQVDLRMSPNILRISQLSLYT